MSGLKPESNRVTIETFTYDIQAYKISSIELNVSILERYLFRQNQSYFRSTMPKRKYHSNARSKYTLFFSCKNMSTRSEPWEEIEIAANKITTMFLYFGKSEPQRSY